MEIFIVYRKSLDGQRQPIIAISKDKNKIQEFMLYKNKEMYVIKEVDMSSIEYIGLCLNHRDCMIYDIQYKTKICKDNKYNMDNVYVASTKVERSMIYDIIMDIYSIFDDYIDIPYDIFDCSIIESLCDIRYNLQCICKYGNNPDIDIAMERIQETIIDNEMDIYLAMCRGDI